MSKAAANAPRRETAIAEVLSEIARSGGDGTRALDLVVQRACEVCDADGGALYRVSGEDAYLSVAFARPGLYPPDDQASRLKRLVEHFAEPRPVSETFLVKRSLEIGAPCQIRDAAKAGDDRADRAQQITGYRAGLGIPLVVAGNPIGALVLVRMTVRAFTERQVQAASTFADQAAIAMQLADLLASAKRQRDQLSRFVSPQVAEIVTQDEGRRLLDGHRREISVLFCDLRGFTAFSESTEPEVVLDVLREFHAEMGRLIAKHDGTLEHFEGDGMMVFFNDPVQMPGHEAAAARLALAMRARFSDLAAAWRRSGFELGMGIGCAVGFATLGQIGFEGRVDYGAVGSVVNLAARLSAHANAGEILVSQRFAAAVASSMKTQQLAAVTLKGFMHPVAIASLEAER